ncbi:MAG: aminotransferase class I/II-fold pyridoxal phosphate-dependent enzyme [Polyangia bacterium]|jgi:aspartate/methionine/tyrosine aminotransferase|nr:aminotransferase class I/II-fold pyridoxal phosphate-dependent enzyme [Polyangia bacterium]
MSLPVELNPNLLAMEYAVRGPIPARAAELRAQGRRTIPCNIGNPQALGQPPISYFRKVLGLLEEPGRISRERRLLGAAPAGVAADDLVSGYVLDVAETMLKGFETGMGAYTESKGPRFIREAVARYIDERDSVKGGPPARRADPDLVFLTNGASEGAMNVIELLLAKPMDGVMIPIPQYPLYSAAIRRLGGVQVGYHPDEDAGWTLSRDALEEAYAGAAADGVNVKLIVAINPGNPTGAILPPESVMEVIAFAREKGIGILADEVYQHNTYGGEWISFAKALGDATDLPLFSLHSTSKGYYGECGHRGGYLEVRNPPRAAGSPLSLLDVLYKRATVSLCPNTLGQALTYLVVSPPPPGSEPYAEFTRERDAVLAALYEKATLIREAFGKMAGVECFGRIGAMYLFPRLGRLPEGASDFDYCMALLEETGLVTVNGSGFGQRPGTSHLRVAFLPPKEMLAEVLPRWIGFHNRYVGA